MSHDDCDEALAHLYTFIDGEVEDHELAGRISQHLDDCPPCGASFSFEDRLKRVVRTKLQEEVPPGVVERIRSVLHREIGH